MLIWNICCTLIQVNILMLNTYLVVDKYSNESQTDVYSLTISTSPVFVMLPTCLSFPTLEQMIFFECCNYHVTPCCHYHDC